ncbi:hypothetical protein NKI25_06790 [Mesorhizobium sp. M0808]|uniref:hypothetical protein n=1 Tax=unclassified Mesorhizobium TaxID=325217 RepID=UPI0033362530
MPDRPFRLRKLRDPDFWLHVAIEKWEWDYSLGAAWMEGPDPLAELRALRLKGKLAKDSGKSVKAGLTADIRVYEGAHFREEKRLANAKLQDVGSLDRVKGGFEVMIIMPDDAFPLVMLMLATERYGHIDISAWKDGPRSSRIRSYEFKRTMTDDWE